MKSHSKLNKVIFILIPIFALAGLSLITYSAFNQKYDASAVSATDFNAGNIISDSVFYNKDAMSAQQIQDFLDRLMPSCYPYGQSVVSGFTPPYVCLKDYHENPTTGETSFEKGGGAFAGGISAAQIIYNASQQYGINPQVLLVMLKKESLGPLTSDTWPVKNQYQYAMGYACPDSGPGNTANCSSEKAGFYKQIMLAAWQFKYYKDHPNDYRYSIGWNDIQYSPNTACGTKRVYIENIATLSLYIYTPYTPNDEALANYPGTSNCGAYGNRNFFMFFSEWFGSTTDVKYTVKGLIRQRWGELGYQNGKMGLPTGPETKRSGEIYWQDFENGVIIGRWDTGFWENKGLIRQRWGELGYQNGKMGLPTGPETKRSGEIYWQDFENGVIIGRWDTGFWENKGLIRQRWGELGYQNGKMGLPTGPETKRSGEIYWQDFENGVIIGRWDTGFWENKGLIRQRWGELGYQNGKMGLPTGPENTIGDETTQKFENGVIIGRWDTGFWENKGLIRQRWGELGYQNGKMGLPTGPETKRSGEIYWQDFENGVIIGRWDTGFWENKGLIRQRWGELGYQNGKMGLPTGPENTIGDETTQKFENGEIILNNLTQKVSEKFN